MTSVCNVCGSANVRKILSLPDYPLNSLYIPNYSNDKKFVSDFEVQQCSTCFHIQAVSDMPLDAFYNDEYNYGTGKPGVQNRHIFIIDRLVEYCKGKKFNRVIEVGCFDLSLLKKLKEKGVSANYWIGIDPVPIKTEDTADEMLFINGYIQEVDIPYSDNSLPDLIISDQVFEHIPKIGKVLEAFTKSIAPNSSFIVCVPSLELLISNFSYHTIIHEHINYYSESSLTNLFSQSNYKLEYSELNYEHPYGYLLQIFAYPEKDNNITPDKPKDFLPEFKNNYKIYLQNLALTKDIISNITDSKLYGFGASDVTANFAYFLKSDLSQLSFIIDDTPFKGNKFIPHLSPKIVTTAEIPDLNKATVLVTAPQAIRAIIKNLTLLKVKRIITPVNVF